MKRQKRKNLFVLFGMSCLLILGMPLHVSAAMSDNNSGISVQYVNIGNVTANLAISGTTARCKGTATSQDGKSCSLTVTLQRKSGNNWVNVKSWSVSAKSLCSINNSYTLSAKGSYRVKAVGKCGTESSTKYSATKSY